MKLLGTVEYMSEKEEIAIKLVVIGEPAVGKTTLRQSYAGKEMSKDYAMTLGADIMDSSVELKKENVIINSQIWDLAGQESFDPITRQFMQGSHGAIVVFDLTRDYTFDEVGKWLQKLHEENKDMEKNIPFILVGNKADLENFIKVEEDKVNDYVEYLNFHRVYSQTKVTYIPTSAKTGYRVKDAFYHLMRTIYINFLLEDGEITKEEADELLSSIENASNIKVHGTGKREKAKFIDPELEKEKDEMERIKRERIEKKVAEEDRIKAEKEEKERIEREREEEIKHVAEQARLRRLEMEKQRAEAIEKTQIPHEKEEKERLEQEKQEMIKIEAVEAKQQRDETDRLAKEEALKLEQERIMQIREVATRRAEIEARKAEDARIEAEKEQLAEIERQKEFRFEEEQRFKADRTQIFRNDYVLEFVDQEFVEATDSLKSDAKLVISLHNKKATLTYKRSASLISKRMSARYAESITKSGYLLPNGQRIAIGFDLEIKE